MPHIFFFMSGEKMKFYNILMSNNLKINNQTMFEKYPNTVCMLTASGDLINRFTIPESVFVNFMTGIAPLEEELPVDVSRGAPKYVPFQCVAPVEEKLPVDVSRVAPKYVPFQCVAPVEEKLPVDVSRGAPKYVPFQCVAPVEEELPVDVSRVAPVEEELPVDVSRVAPVEEELPVDVSRGALRYAPFQGGAPREELPKYVTRKITFRCRTRGATIYPMDVALKYMSGFKTLCKRLENGCNIVEFIANVVDYLCVEYEKAQAWICNKLKYRYNYDNMHYADIRLIYPAIRREHFDERDPDMVIFKHLMKFYGRHQEFFNKSRLRMSTLFRIYSHYYEEKSNNLYEVCIKGEPELVEKLGILPIDIDLALICKDEYLRLRLMEAVGDDFTDEGYIMLCAIENFTIDMLGPNMNRYEFMFRTKDIGEHIPLRLDVAEGFMNGLKTHGRTASEFLDEVKYVSIHNDSKQFYERYCYPHSYELFAIRLKMNLGGDPIEFTDYREYGKDPREFYIDTCGKLESCLQNVHALLEKSTSIEQVLDMVGLFFNITCIRTFDVRMISHTITRMGVDKIKTLLKQACSEDYLETFSKFIDSILERTS